MRLPRKLGENLAVDFSEDASGECVGLGTRGDDRRVADIDDPLDGGDTGRNLGGETAFVCFPHF